ncbi:MAG: aminotransferase class V-fold PLP-dependent enzyme [Flavobacteriaceae bacterium]|nr:aminotransferase class V-fold PLP-dependent enzyme [Flavobacteriaceae bacterium]
MKRELALFQKLTTEFLAKEIDEPVTKPFQAESLWKDINISLQSEGVSEEEFEKILRDIVLNTPRTATNKFFNQLFGGRNPKATLGDLLAVILNNSMYTYKVAGPQVGIEIEIINQVCNIIDYPKQSGGTITSGGSVSNLIAMLMARDKASPEVRYKSFHEKLIGYTSEVSHYSIKKNAAICGIGTEQIRKIAIDKKGLLIPEVLEEAIKKDIANNQKPFFINATAGTTVLGAFDPVEEIIKIAKKYNIWVHVDGAYCGSVIFSNKYKHLVKGLEKANSFNFNAHKMIGTPLTCSVLVTLDKKYLYESLSMEADYLYQTDGDDFNLGKTSLQCGRRNNALKFWTLWKSVGTKGLETIVDNQFMLADVARGYVKTHSDYSCYSFDESVSVCFNYKDIPANKLCTLLYEHAELVIGFGTFKEDTFIRLVTVNPANSKEEIIDLFKTIEGFVRNNHELF